MPRSRRSRRMGAARKRALQKRKSQKSERSRCKSRGKVYYFGHSGGRGKYMCISKKEYTKRRRASAAFHRARDR